MVAMRRILVIVLPLAAAAGAWLLASGDRVMQVARFATEKERTASPPSSAVDALPAVPRPAVEHSGDRTTAPVVVEPDEPALVGLVRTASGAPVPDARVRLLPAGTLPGPFPVAAAAANDHEVLEAWMDRQARLLEDDDGEELAVVSADADGAFRFVEVAAPTVDVEARIAAGVGLSDSLLDVAIPRGGTAEVELVLPDPAEVRGRVLAPEGVSFDGLSLDIESREDDVALGPGAGFVLRLATAQIDLAADGSFASGPVRAGRYTVALVAEGPRMDRPGGGSTVSGGHRIPLGVVRAIPGGADVLLDATDVFPGAVHVTLEVDGTRASAWLVLSYDDQGEWTGAGATDARGSALLRPLPYGRHRLAVLPPDASAFHCVPEAVEVRPGTTAETRIDIAPVHGRVLCLDGDSSRALAEATIEVVPAISAEYPFGPSARARTDAAGILELVLAPGAYRVFLAERPTQEEPRSVGVTLRPGEPGTALEWTVAGPSTAEIRLR